MPGKIPKEIKPNPLISAGVEIRFKSNFLEKPSDRFNFFYKILNQDYPQFENKSGGIIIEQADQLGIIECTFKNDINSISIGQGLILFENLKDYPLWEGYFEFIKSNLLLFEKQGFHFSAITRVGIRYISLLPNADNLKNATDYNSGFEIDGFNLINEVVRNQYSDGKGQNLTVQVANGIKVNANAQDKTGLYIDIDASLVNLIQTKFDQDFFNIIDELHSKEKEVFTTILKDEYTSTLNIIY